MSVSKRLIINVTLFLAVASGSILTGCRSEKEPVDYVNPYRKYQSFAGTDLSDSTSAQQYASCLSEA